MHRRTKVREANYCARRNTASSSPPLCTAIPMKECVGAICWIKRSSEPKTSFLVACFCLAVCLPFGIAMAATSWNDLIEAANREGQVAIYGSGYYGDVFRDFQKKFPKIRIQYESGGGASQFAVRLMNEDRKSVV